MGIFVYFLSELVFLGLFRFSMLILIILYFRLTNCVKAREQDRASMQLMERRLIEAQTKVKELEKELTAEKRSREQASRANALTLRYDSSSALNFFFKFINLVFQSAL